MISKAKDLLKISNTRASIINNTEYASKVEVIAAKLLVAAEIGTTSLNIFEAVPAAVKEELINQGYTIKDMKTYIRVSWEKA